MAKKKVVKGQDHFVYYIAAPYRPKGIWRKIPIISWLIIDRNIKIARRVALKYWRAGNSAICPHLNTAHFTGKHDSIWLEGDIEQMKRTDIVVFVEGWESSSGCLKEYEITMDLGREHEFVKRDGTYITNNITTYLDWYYDKHESYPAYFVSAKVQPEVGGCD